jgi:nucleoside-diphosphate-sugar epimerase
MLWALEKAGQRPRFLFVSSTSVYGQDKGEWVDEESTTNPNRFSGRLMLQGEGLVRDYSGESSAIRFGGIYGPGRHRLIELVRAGQSCQSDPLLYTNRIHRDDCVGALVHLLYLDSLASIYVGVDSYPAPQCEIMGWLAQKLKAPAPNEIAGSSMGKQCRNRRLLETGYRLLYPTFREGYEAVLGG